MLAIFGGKFLKRKSGTKRTEDDLLSVRRITPFRIITLGSGQLTEVRAIAAGGENVHRFVIIPGIPAFLPCSAKIQLRFLFLFRFRILVSGRKENFIGSRPEESAGCLSNSR